jgi:hypothetical protein
MAVSSASRQQPAVSIQQPASQQPAASSQSSEQLTFHAQHTITWQNRLYRISARQKWKNQHKTIRFSTTKFFNRTC